MKKKRIIEDYNKTAPFYDKRYKEIQFEKFKILNGLELEGQILDHGCGTGLLAKYLSKQLIGCDISFEMCKLAKDKELVVCADVDYLPFKKDSFDSILSITTIQNLPDFNHCFKEVRRVLKPNSLFVFTILKKSFTNEILTKLIGFKIKQKQEYGEDIGFLLD